LSADRLLGHPYSAEFENIHALFVEGGVGMNAAGLMDQLKGKCDPFLLRNIVAVTACSLPSSSRAVLPRAKQVVSTSKSSP
jgi:hypothetical protein